ncbi:hypothetical protein BMETH_2147_0 [methanotrophic bacterial endosymbiont of Bathymodiolus sp.]|nr:hypothetical protein BMETH_2147_0 [methanotrophic bacterial endosymbiont of Bathymodiolus sp.]
MSSPTRRFHWINGARRKLKQIDIIAIGAGYHLSQKRTLPS